MIRQCFAANTGIRFHTSLLRQVGLDPASLYPIVKPRPSALYVSSLLADPPIAKPVTTVATEDIHTTIPPESADSVNTVPPSPLSAAPLLASSSTDTEQTLINRADTKLSLAEMLQKLADEPGRLTEEEEDLADALCPIYDQLEIAKGWWTLELIPMMQRYQKPNNEWVDALVYVHFFISRLNTGTDELCSVNMGRGRDVPTPTLPETFNVHRSVDIRMQAKDLLQSRDGKKIASYVPNARYKATPHWVD